jgi:hypothetical protein
MPGKPAAHLRKTFFSSENFACGGAARRFAAGEGRLVADLAGTLQLTDLMQKIVNLQFGHQ